MAYRKSSNITGWAVAKIVIVAILVLGALYALANCIYCACVGVTFPEAVETFFGVIEKANTVTPPAEEGAIAMFNMMI